MTFLAEMDAATGLIDGRALGDRGIELRERYNGAEPFPHIAIDDFLPRPLAEACVAEFARSRNEDQRVFNRDQERLKRQYKPDELSPRVRALFYSFNSRPFLKLIENITGIEGLIPDPYFMGGGLHEIDNGGHLSMHADFNYHKPLHLERRINALIYLNEDWQDAYGGQLELWDRGMTQCVQSYVPVFNRCVIFNTTSDSNHGNPHPVNHPAGVSRKSIALYYYTATWSDERRQHTTQFRPRPATADRRDWQVRRSELYRDVMPPIALRAVARARRLVRGNRG